MQIYYCLQLHVIQYNIYLYTVTICSFIMKCVDLLCIQPVTVCGCDICCGECLCEGTRHIWPLMNHVCCILIIIIISQCNE
jgi:hypothetical protein